MNSRDFYDDRSTSKLFEQCVVTYGEKVALHSDAGSLTYDELNIKANILAHYLRRCGMQPNTLVAVYLERSLEFIIVILAIIKAGGAYIPLDIDIPISRNFTILMESNPFKIITNGTGSQVLHDVLPATEMKNKIIEINTIFEECVRKDSHNLLCINSPDDLIYVMYTSGSTANPKGCMISHRGVIGLVKNVNYIQIKTTDCIAHASNTAFDASTFEIWGALLNGSKLIIAPKNIFYDIDLFQIFLLKNHVTILWLTASIFHVFAEKNPSIFNHLRYLLVGGDVVHSTAVNKVLKQSPNSLIIINGYGPTECTTFSTFYPMKSLSDVRDPLPIGKPISGKICLVLNENLKPVLNDEVGELCIAGLGLAKGYLNQPELTEEKFILFSLDGENILRFYRSGDYVKLLADGNLQFLGRKDRQIKSKGYRINLDEIEAHIVKFSAISQVAVVVENSEKNVTYLVAYVSLHQSVSYNFADFRQFLKENLPHYMIPAKIICLDNIPLTPNGKIDRKILKQLKGKNILTEDEKPTNNLEKSITGLLSQFLEIPHMSVTENFFDLGANSLILSEMCIALNAKLGKEKKVSIADIFAYPTTRLLAEYINANESTTLKTLKNEVERAVFQRHKLMLKKRNRHESI